MQVPKASALAIAAALCVTQPTFAQSDNRPELIDYRGRVLDDFDARVEGTSRRKVVLISRGHEQAFLQEVYFGMRDLSGQGVPIVFVVTDSKLEGTLTLEIVIDGRRYGQSYSHTIGGEVPENTRAIWRTRTLEAHRQLQSVVRAREDRERRERVFLSTEIDHGVTQTVAEWQSLCAKLASSELRAQARDAIIQKEGIARAEAAARVENLRLLCSGASKKIERFRLEMGLAD